MRYLARLLVVAGLGYALPQEDCSTTTSQLIIPTKTATYTTTPIVTVHATGAEDLGTFTLVTTISDTTTLETITSTVGVCGATGVITVPAETTTAYTNAPTPYNKRSLGLNPRGDCTVTVTSTTTYGQTYTFVAAQTNTTFTAYTAFTQATVTTTKTGGKDYAIATALATTTSSCGESTVTEPSATSTVTLDARCSPSAMTSAYNGFGLLYLSDTPTTGGTYTTTTDDASACCQMCADANKCATSAWDIRSGACRLEFSVEPLSGDLNCGEGLLAYYGAGPDYPMAPGTGWFVAELCGHASYGSAQPDDGT